MELSLSMTNNWNSFEGSHAGETGLIIGNGPSLKNVPVAFLKKYSSFGTNRIYLLDGFEPTYYVSVNQLVIEQSIERIKGLKSFKFLPDKYCSQFTNVAPLESRYHPCFSMNPAAYIYDGYTVTYVCMQIAYYMGFDNILLVGVDHRFSFDGNPNQEVISKGEDQNHFHPDYFGEGVRWNNPDLERSEEAYRMAKEVFERDGKRIINLTKNTALNVFRKGKITEW